MNKTKYGVQLLLLGKQQMRNEAAARILPPQIPQSNQKYGVFLEIWVKSRKYSHPIQTATYPPFTKGTSMWLLQTGFSKAPLR